MKIVRPLTEDGQVGWDEHGQFVSNAPDGPDRTVMTFITDVRGRTCVICERGWEPTGPSMRDQTEWRILGGRERVHETCLVRHAGLTERADFYRALIDAKVRFRTLRAVPNRYWPPSDPWAKRPWYEAELVEHPAMVVLGWRKRVIHVEVMPQGGTSLDWHQAAKEFFEYLDVTKHFTPESVLIHAYGTEKMKSHLADLMKTGGYQVVQP